MQIESVSIFPVQIWTVVGVPRVRNRLFSVALETFVSRMAQTVPQKARGGLRVTETTTKISIFMPYIKQRTLLMTFGTPTCYLGCDCACRRLDSREVDRDDVVAREGPYTLKLLVCRKYNDEDKGKQQAIIAP